MKLVKCGKIVVASLCMVATLAGTAMPALAISPAGYTSLAQIEECNDVDPDKVQAIKNALANITVKYDEDDTSWDLNSNYEDFEIEGRNNFVMPWLFVKNDYADLYLGIMVMSQDSDGFYYWTKADILANDITNPEYTLSYESKNVSRTYATEDQNYVEILSFVGNDDDIECFKKVLSYERAYLRVNGNYVNNTRRSRTSLINQENRQAIADIVNLYDLLKSATPEERAAALRG